MSLAPFLFNLSLKLSSVDLSIQSNSALAGSVYYATECGELIKIGTYEWRCCKWECIDWETYCVAYEDGVCIDWDTRCVDWECVKDCNQHTCFGVWFEYRANTTECNPNILRRQCRSEGGPRVECCSHGSCEVKCDPWEICEDCGSWQIAERGCLVTKAGLIKPECKCEDNCIDKPKSPPRYYDNATYPTDPCNPEKGKDPKNIFLPVKLDWDDVRGWMGGWREGAICPIGCLPECPRCPYPTLCYEEAECIHVYEIKIKGELRDCYTGLTIYEYKGFRSFQDYLSGFIPPCPCFFKSNQTYQWKVRYCCTQNKECGPWSNWWQFTTNHAPEPKAPLDPDWTGKELIPGQPLEVELKWCDIYFEEEKPKSFKLFFYLGDEPGEEETIIRHPWIGEFPKILSDLRFDEPEPIFRNERYGFFTKPPFTYEEMDFNFYAWRVAACERFEGRGKCTNFSQKWRFAIKDIVLEIPTRIAPLDNIEIPVGLPVTIQWSHILGAKSYILEIRKNENVIKSKIITIPTEVVNYPDLHLNTIYQWRVRACRGFEGTQCGNWSEEWQFKTTGRPPKLITPKGTNIIIPADFQWEKVPGAKSYIFRIQGGEEDKSSSSPLANARVPDLDLTKIVEEPKISLGFPNLRQEKTYSWQVKTCARPYGRLCGNWSSPQTFTTFKLGTPINPFPKDNTTIYTYQMPKTFSWNPVLGAKYYKIIINQIKQEVVADNSAFVNFHYPGTYQWQVQACLDENCEERGNPAIWNFTLLAKEAPEEFRPGLVPCGRRYDNPDTPWCETAPCQIKHIFILLYIVLNFVLWTLIPLILIILVVYTGAIFYFSLSTGTTETIPKVRALWKSAGIGFAVIFLGWSLICFILTLFNYQLGPWYHIPL